MNATNIYEINTSDFTYYLKNTYGQFSEISVIYSRTGKYKINLPIAVHLAGSQIGRGTQLVYRVQHTPCRFQRKSHPPVYRSQDVNYGRTCLKIKKKIKFSTFVFTKLLGPLLKKKVLFQFKKIRKSHYKSFNLNLNWI